MFCFFSSTLERVNGEWPPSSAPLWNCCNYRTSYARYYPLDLASAMPVLSLINQTEQSTGRSTEVVVDTCAAPGGKFLVMAGFYLPSTSARLIAIEWDNFRLSRFKQNLRLYLPSDLRKSARLTVRRGDASKILSQLPNGPFDAVLVDAPCSSERERLLRANGRLAGWQGAGGKLFGPRMLIKSYI